MRYSLGDDPSDKATLRMAGDTFRNASVVARVALRTLHRNAINQNKKNIARLERELRAAQHGTALAEACLELYDDIDSEASAEV